MAHFRSPLDSTAFDLYVDKVLARALDDDEYEWVTRLTYG
jgi:hypothetical protein